MKQILYILLFIFSFNFVYGQNNDTVKKNEYFVNLNYSFLTSGDQAGIHFTNEYNRLILPKLKIKAVFGYVHSENESTLNNNANILTGGHEDGIKVLDLKTKQQSYLHTDVLLSCDVFKWEDFKFNLSAGGSIAYISNSYIIKSMLHNIDGEQNFRLAYPYYSRVIDLGITIDVNIIYNISDKFSLGAVCRVNNYSKSGYRFYDLGLKAGIKF